MRNEPVNKLHYAIAMAGLLGVVALSLLAGGCSQFRTVQTDERYNEQTGEKTTITTKASSSTFFDSKSSLAKWKASQTEKSQGAEVGGLQQESNGTNIVNLFEAVARGAAAGAAKSVVPIP